MGRKNSSRRLLLVSCQTRSTWLLVNSSLQLFTRTNDIRRCCYMDETTTAKLKEKFGYNCLGLNDKNRLSRFLVRVNNCQISSLLKSVRKANLVGICHLTMARLRTNFTARRIPLPKRRGNEYDGGYFW
jgi:hypothetical protein